MRYISLLVSSVELALTLRLQVWRAIESVEAAIL